MPDLANTVDQISAHAGSAFVNLYSYAAMPGRWFCSVRWDDDRKECVMAQGKTATQAARGALELLKAESRS